jgi:predicted DCC family thiol-disulfide oxidoreductase YuxK
MSAHLQNHAVILFDGVCNLCNRFVQMIISSDKQGFFKFAPLQSDAAAALLDKSNHQHYLKSAPDSVLLIEDGRVYERSAAVLRIMRRLSGFRVLAFFYRLMPPKLRDVIYNFIARKRYRWFGRKNACMAPDPDISQRFL